MKMQMMGYVYLSNGKNYYSMPYCLLPFYKCSNLHATTNYRTTAKHYIDKREVAKQMVKNILRIFDKKTQKRTPDCTPTIKKDFTSL
jgi:hypothetical protein